MIQYAYDPNGSRVSKLVGSTYTYYVGGTDGKTDVLYANTTAKPTYNLFALDNIGQVKRDTTARTRFYYLKDHLGNTRVTVNASSGIDSYFDYYPYGQVLDGRSSISSADARYKYPGKERDAETGGDYFGARYYDARIGRWLAVDPSAETDPNLSPFLYAGNSPLRNVDPDGKSFEDYIKGIVASVSAAVNPTYTPPSPSAVSGDQQDYAVGRVVGDVVGAAIGAAETAGGLSGGSLGVALCGTGVGAVAGVPLVAVSSAVAAHGAVTAVAAVSHVGDDVGNATQASATSSLQDQGKGATQGKTADGRPTDQHGNVLGGSGKPRQNTVEHSTVKRAKDAARSEGKGAPVKHPKPKKGNGHYHATDEEGEKIPNSTHHEYP